MDWGGEKRWTRGLVHRHGPCPHGREACFGRDHTEGKQKRSTWGRRGGRERDSSLRLDCIELDSGEGRDGEIDARQRLGDTKGTPEVHAPWL